MKNLHIQNSYKVWNINTMYETIEYASLACYGRLFANDVLNRSYRGMYIEWYLHNIGYYLTLPFIKKESIKKLNLRFKDLDLEEHIKNEKN